MMASSDLSGSLSGHLSGGASREEEKLAFSSSSSTACISSSSSPVGGVSSSAGVTVTSNDDLPPPLLTDTKKNVPHITGASANTNSSSSGGLDISTSLSSLPASATSSSSLLSSSSLPPSVSSTDVLRDSDGTSPPPPGSFISSFNASTEGKTYHLQNEENANSFAGTSSALPAAPPPSLSSTSGSSVPSVETKNFLQSKRNANNDADQLGGLSSPAEDSHTHWNNNKRNDSTSNDNNNDNKTNTNNNNSNNYVRNTQGSKKEGEAECGSEASSSVWGGWLKVAGDFVTSKVSQLQQDIQPDLEEFASSIRSDATSWVKSKSSKLIGASSSFSSNKNNMQNDNNNNKNNNNYDECNPPMRNIYDDLHFNEKINQTGTPPHPHTKQTNKNACNNRNNVNLSEAQKTHGNSKQKAKSQPTFLNDASASLRLKCNQMRSSECTYTQEKWSSREEEEKFLAFRVDSYDVLDWLCDDAVMSMKAKLVPREVSEDMFWKRFLFKVNLLRREEEAFSSLLRNVKNTDEKQDADEEDISWDDVEGSSLSSSWETLPNEKSDFSATKNKAATRASETKREEAPPM